VSQPDAIGFILVAECPDPDQARAMPDAHGWPYRGVWHTPEPGPAAVHLFAEPAVYPDTMLLDAGWTRDCARTEPHTCGAELEGDA
jgi:hypothetical protein